MKKQSGYVVLLLSLIVSAIGVTLAVNSLLVSTQVTDVAISSEEAIQADALARSCTEYAIEKLIETQTYGGDETVTIGSNSCRILSITGVKNGDRVIHTQATVSSVTRYIQTQISSIAPQVVIEDQTNLATLSDGVGNSGTINSNNPFLVDPDNLVMWIKASSVEYQSTNFPAHDFGRINAIRDASDTSIVDASVSQSTESLQPTFRHFGFNNLPTLVFDGVDDYLLGGTDILHDNTNGLSIFVVGSSSTTDTDETFVGKYDSVNNEREWRIQNDDVAVNESATSLQPGEIASYTPAQDEFRLVAGIWTPGQAIIPYVDGSAGTAASVSVTDVTSTTEPVIVGAFAGGSSDFLSGEIAEIIVYNRALTDTERQSVETYLNTKYNLF